MHNTDKRFKEKLLDLGPVEFAINIFQRMKQDKILKNLEIYNQDKDTVAKTQNQLTENSNNELRILGIIDWIATDLPTIPPNKNSHLKIDLERKEFLRKIYDETEQSWTHIDWLINFLGVLNRCYGLEKKRYRKIESEKVINFVNSSDYYSLLIISPFMEILRQVTRDFIASESRKRIREKNLNKLERQVRALAKSREEEIPDEINEEKIINEYNQKKTEFREIYLKSNKEKTKKYLIRRVINDFFFKELISPEIVVLFTQSENKEKDYDMSHDKKREYKKLKEEHETIMQNFYKAIYQEIGCVMDDDDFFGKAMKEYQNLILKKAENL